MQRFRIPLVASLMAVFSLSACGGSDDPPPTGLSGTDVTSVSVSPASISVVRGGTATAVLNVNRRSGYTGTVTLLASGAPSGVTVSFSPASLSGSETQSTVTISGSGAATAGTASITIGARGADGETKSATVSASITVPEIGLSVAPSSTNITQGQTAGLSVTVARSGGYTGEVSLSATGLPTGLTASFDPASLSGTASTSSLTLAASESLAPGDYSFSINASGSGVESRMVTVQLSVIASATPSVSLAASPAQLSLAAGESRTSTVTVTRSGGFTGSVTFAVSGSLPQGVAVSFSPQGTTGATTEVTVSTTSGAARGPATITIQATGSGIDPATVALGIDVLDPPGIALSLETQAQSIARGDGASNTLTVTRSGSFAGAVALSVQGLPAGVTTTLPASVAAASGTSTVPFVVQVAAATPAGTYSIEIAGAGDGWLNAETTLSLTVTDAGAFLLAATPSALTIQAGNDGASTISITREGGYSGSVTFALEDAPSGVTGSFAPASTSGNSTQLSLSVGSATTAGSYTLNVRGTAAGVTDVVVPIALTVTTSGGGTGAIGYRFCDPSRIPVWFAYQDGNGAWTRVTADVSNTFNFGITSETGGVTFVLQEGANEFDIVTFYNTRDELRDIAARECITDPPTRTVHGSFTGLTGLQQAYMYANNTITSGSIATPSFTNTTFPVGVVDILAVRYELDFDSFSLVPDKAILRRNQEPANGSTMAPFAFDGGEAFQIASAQVTLQNAGSNNVVISQFETANGKVGSMAFGALGASGSTTSTVYGVPSALTQTGDFHSLLATTYSDTTAVRIAMLTHRELANRTIQFGPDLEAQSASTIASAPYARLRISGTWSATYDTGIGVSWVQESTLRNWTVNASRGYTGAAAAYQLDMPDLSGVDGFQSSWGLSVGKQTSWGVTAINAISANSAEGASWLSATRRGSITP